MDDKTKLEELTVHSYDVYLKEKRSTRSMKDTIFVDLVENNLHSIEAYINTINVITSILTINRYIKESNVISVVTDWSGQIYLRTAISQYLVYDNSSGITNNILSFLLIIDLLHIFLNSCKLIFLQYQSFFLAIYKYIFGKKKY